MPSAEQIIRRLKEAGLKFDSESEHAKVFRGTVAGKLRRVAVLRRRDFEVKAAESLLRQAGLTVTEIQEFIRACSS